LGGTGNLESTTGGLSTLTPESSWAAYNQGPIGFQALGTSGGAAAPALAASSGPSPSPTLAGRSIGKVATGRRSGRAARASTIAAAGGRATARSLRPRVMIDGAPSTVTAGTGVQLAALVSGGGPHLRWTASAGSITATGLYRAPSVPPPGGTVVIRASAGGGAHDVRTVSIVAPARPEPAPTVYLPEGALASASGSGIAAPQAMLVGHELVITTSVGEAGRASIGAYLGARRLGGCTVQTPAGRSFTCQIGLTGVSRHAAIGVSASLRAGGKLLRSARAAAPIAPMKMISQLVRNGSGRAAWQFICSPSLRPGSTYLP
jgi:hypothetical protein